MDKTEFTQVCADSNFYYQNEDIYITWPDENVKNINKNIVYDQFVTSGDFQTG